MTIKLTGWVIDLLSVLLKWLIRWVHGGSTTNSTKSQCSLLPYRVMAIQQGFQLHKFHPTKNLLLNINYDLKTFTEKVCIPNINTYTYTRNAFIDETVPLRSDDPTWPNPRSGQRLTNTVSELRHHTNRLDQSKLFPSENKQSLTENQCKKINDVLGILKIQ